MNLFKKREKEGDEKSKVLYLLIFFFDFPNFV